MGLCLVSLAGCASAPPLAPTTSIPVTHSTETATQAQARVITVARSLLGAPYRYGGVTPSGFDCSGFILYVYQEAANIELPHSTHELVKIGRPIPVADLRPADLVYFKIEHQKPLHVGIYIGRGRFIHAPSAGGQINIQPLGMDYWQQRYLGARRVL